MEHARGRKGSLTRSDTFTVHYPETMPSYPALSQILENVGVTQPDAESPNASETPLKENPPTILSDSRNHKSSEGRIQDPSQLSFPLVSKLMNRGDGGVCQSWLPFLCKSAGCTQGCRCGPQNLRLYIYAVQVWCLVVQFGVVCGCQQ